MEKWVFVGLFPFQAYEKLGLVKFFEAAHKLRRAHKSDAALVVAWSYCFGLANKLNVLALSGMIVRTIDGKNYDDFRDDASKTYGPAGPLYPGAFN